MRARAYAADASGRTAIPSITAIAAVAAVAGTALSTISQVNAANYRAKVANNNAKTAQNNAAYAAQASSVQTEAAGLKASQRLAGLTAAQAAAGVDVTSGSPAEVQKSQHALGFLDTETVAHEGAMKVYGYETQRADFEAERKAAKAEVLPDIVGGVVKSIGQVAGAAGSLGIGGGGGASPDASGAIDSMGQIPITPSMINGSPSVPSQYNWMRGNTDYNSGLDGEFSF